MRLPLRRSGASRHRSWACPWTGRSGRPRPVFLEGVRTGKGGWIVTPNLDILRQFTADLAKPRARPGRQPSGCGWPADRLGLPACRNTGAGEGSRQRPRSQPAGGRRPRRGTRLSARRKSRRGRGRRSPAPDESGASELAHTAPRFDSRTTRQSWTGSSSTSGAPADSGPGRPWLSEAGAADPDASARVPRGLVRRRRNLAQLSGRGPVPCADRVATPGSRVDAPPFARTSSPLWALCGAGPPLQPQAVRLGAGHRLLAGPEHPAIETRRTATSRPTMTWSSSSAGTSWDGIWQSERHVAMHLAERHPVLWVDPQISHLSPMRNPAASEALHGPACAGGPEHHPAHPGHGPRCDPAPSARSRRPPGASRGTPSRRGDRRERSHHPRLLAQRHARCRSIGAERLLRDR